MSRLNRPPLTRHRQRPRVVLTRPRPARPEPPSLPPPPPPAPPPQQPTSTIVKNFNIDVAVELMELCMNSYEQLIYYKNNNGSLNGWSIKVSDNSIYEVIDILYSYEKQQGKDIDIVTTLPLGFIAKKNNLPPDLPDYYICFRGTETAKEWEDNGTFNKVKCSFLNGNEKVHDGFQRIYTSDDVELVDPEKSPQDRIKSCLNSLAITAYRRLYVTGHSLGAALAAVCVLDVVVNTVHKNAIMYNFAGPAVGDQNFATTFKNNIGNNFCNGATNNNLCSFRVVNINDKVPDLPPEKIGPIKLGYVHVNGCSGQSICNNSSASDTSQNGLYLIKFGSNAKEAHHGTLYLSKLQSIQKGIQDGE